MDKNSIPLYFNIDLIPIYIFLANIIKTIIKTMYKRNDGNNRLPILLIILR